MVYVCLSYWSIIQRATLSPRHQQVFQYMVANQGCEMSCNWVFFFSLEEICHLLIYFASRRPTSEVKPLNRHGDRGRYYAIPWRRCLRGDLLLEHHLLVDKQFILNLSVFSSFSITYSCSCWCFAFFGSFFLWTIKSFIIRICWLPLLVDTLYNDPQRWSEKVPRFIARYFVPYIDHYRLRRICCGPSPWESLNWLDHEGWIPSVR